MNIFSKSKAADRFRQFEDQRNGVIKVYLTPSQQDELRAAKIAISQARANKVEDASARRDERLRLAKETYEVVKRDAEAEHRVAVAQADADFDAAEHELDSKYVQPLTKEQIALLTAKPGEVVRIAPTATAKVAEAV